MRHWWVVPVVCQTETESPPPHYVRMEPHQPHTEPPKASHLHLTGEPAWKKTAQPSSTPCLPQSQGQGTTALSALPAAGLGFLLPLMAGTQTSRSSLEVFECRVAWKLENPESKL